MHKPELGVIPQWLWIELRVWELMRAILRRRDSNQDIPMEWLLELHAKLGVVITRNEPKKSDELPH